MLCEKTKNKNKKKTKKAITTNKYEQRMSESSQHRIPYCTPVSSCKGPVSLVVWLVGHNGTFALVEVNSHVETEMELGTMVSADFPTSPLFSVTGCSGKGCVWHATWDSLGLKWILFRLTNPSCVCTTYERGVTLPKTSPCRHWSPRWWLSGLVHTNFPGVKGDKSLVAVLS